jgi:hypothetical protein
VKRPKANQTDVDTDFERGIAALSSIGTLLLRLIGLSAAISALLLFAGAVNVALYSSAIGAPWLVQLTTLSILLDAASLPMAILFIGAFLVTSMVLMLPRDAGKLVKRVEFVAQIVFVLASIVALAVLEHPTDPNPALAGKMGLIFIGVSCVSFAALVFAISVRDRYEYTMLSLRALLLGVVLGPGVMGMAEGRCAVVPSCRVLPEAVFLDGHGQGWVVLSTFDSVVLANFDVYPAEFRSVDRTEVKILMLDEPGAERSRPPPSVPVADENRLRTRRTWQGPQ